MKYRKLGNSGLKVSEISYGNWITHGAQLEDVLAEKCVFAALDQGINTFDTADVYSDTRAETLLGTALKGISRESIVLSTKVCHPTGTGPNDQGLSRKHIFESCNASLRRLGTDYIDIYFAHRFDPHTPLEESFLAFSDLVRQGKILYLGVSEWTAAQIKEGARLSKRFNIPFVASQPQYSMLWRVIEGNVLPACAEAGIGQMTWSPLAQGILSGKYKAGHSLPTGSRALDKTGSRFLERLAGQWMQYDVLDAIQRLIPIAHECDLTLPQLAIAWILQNNQVSSVIIGASQPEQIQENVRASGLVLQSSIMQRIDEILDPFIERNPESTG
jgi:voltage-dependent potassium channel beta subunit